MNTLLIWKYDLGTFLDKSVYFLEKNKRKTDHKLACVLTSCSSPLAVRNDSKKLLYPHHGPSTQVHDYFSNEDLPLHIGARQDDTFRSSSAMEKNDQCICETESLGELHGLVETKRTRKRTHEPRVQTFM